MKAIVHFRTEPNGAFKWMRNYTRGWWRVLVVKDVMESNAITSKNVVEELFCGRSGLRGATPRSNYYIGDDYLEAQRIADEYNNSNIQVQ